MTMKGIACYGVAVPVGIASKPRPVVASDWVQMDQWRQGIMGEAQ